MKKLYQVVNDQDEIIGYKNREDIDAKTDIYRISALWLTNSDGKILIAQRVLSKDKDPGKWGPAAAGTLEKGETYESNIYKESAEEIGLVGVTFIQGPKQRFYEPRQAFCQWYIGECDKDPTEFKLQEEEVEQIRWIDYDELAKDVKSNPEKYTPSMPLILTIFAKTTNF